MSDLAQVFSQIDSYREQMIQAQRELTAIPALGPQNGGQGEKDKAELVQRWFTDLGLEIIRVDAPDQRVASGIRPNLVGIHPGGDGPHRWVLSHLDVVPPGELSLWGGDPYTVRVEGGRLLGRGVLDDQSGLVSSFFALKALKELGIRPAGPVGLLAVADEETGSGYGLDYLLKQRRDLFSERDFIVVPDIGNEDSTMVEIAEKSILWLKVEVDGVQCHGSTPDRGCNALYAAARMMVAVREGYQRYPATDPLFRLGSTFEPTAKEAGVNNVNTIPGRDVFYVDCRVLPEYQVAEVLEFLQGRFEEIAREEGVKVRITPQQYLQAPPPTPVDSPVVQALMRGIKTVTGRDPHPVGVGGGTVAAFFRQQGLNVACWFTANESAHMPDEWMEIDWMLTDAKVFAHLYLGA